MMLAVCGMISQLETISLAVRKTSRARDIGFMK
jgi:hypothetical protein